MVKIFLDNPFPIDVVKVPQSVRCVDLNLLHSKIAVVDESSTLFVYDLVSKELLFQEPTAVSVFWNAYCDDLLSFSGFGVLNIKASNFPIYQQKMAVSRFFTDIDIGMNSRDFLYIFFFFSLFLLKGFCSRILWP